jgi:hypothetical protein
VRLSKFRCTALLFFISNQIFAQAHFIEITAGSGLAFSVSAGSYRAPVGFGGVRYRFLAKRVTIGFTTGIEFGGYNLRADFGVGTPTYNTQTFRFIGASAPLFFTGNAGRRKVKFIYDIGTSLLLSIDGKYVYHYKNINSTYFYNNPVAMGAPAFGLGIQLYLSKLMRLRLLLENSSYHGFGIHQGIGARETLMLRASLAFKCKMPKEKSKT